MSLGQQVLLLHEILLQEGDAIEIDCAALVLNLDNLDGLFRRQDALSQFFRLLLGLKEIDESVLDLVARPNDGFLIPDDQFLEFSILQANVVGEPAIIEDVPLKGRSDDALHGVILEEVAEALGLPANGAGDGDVGIEIGACDADLS